MAILQALIKHEENSIVYYNLAVKVSIQKSRLRQQNY